MTTGNCGEQAMAEEPILWQPDTERIAQANLTEFTRRYLPGADYQQLHRWSIDEPSKFWQAIWEYCAIQGIPNLPVYRQDSDLASGVFYPAAVINYAANLMRGDDARVALIGISEDGRRSELTMGQVRKQVSILQQALRLAGVKRGNCVAAVVPNCPEAMLIMLAAQSLGAVFTSCSPDFGTTAIVERLAQVDPKVVFVCSAYRYKGKLIDLGEKLSGLIQQMQRVRKWVVFDYTDVAASVPSEVMRWDDFCNDIKQREVEFAPVLASDPGFYLFSSGTTGKPKSIIHSGGGLLLKHLSELVLHIDLKAGHKMFFYTTCGWMMWNWQASALAANAAVVLYDGHPMYPNAGRLATLAIEEKVTHFGASARYFAACAKSAVKPRARAGGDFLRCVMSTGSPLLHESFDYLYEHWGRDLHVASISGGTDICACFVGGVPTLPVRRGEIQAVELGCDVAAYDEKGRSIMGHSGEMVCRNAIPSMPLGLVGDQNNEKYRQTYFSRFPDVWCHGDWVSFTKEGSLVIYGRSDAVLNPGGVRIGTAEIYRAVENLNEVVEAVAVGQRWQDDQRIVLFVCLNEGIKLDAKLKNKICEQIRNRNTPRHVPAKILAVADIPRTRSGKISELAVAAVINNRTVSNTGALANPQALNLYRDLPELSQ